MADYKIGIRIAGDLDKSFMAAINGAKSGLGSLEAVSKAGDMLIKGSYGALGAAATGLVAFGKHAVEVGMEYEQAMGAVAAASNATAVEYEKLDTAAKEAGRTTSKTATEAANALEYMAMAGWSAGDSAEALIPVLKLSEATGMDLARTSDLVTDSMSTMGLGIDDLGHYLDVMTAAATNSNQNVEMFMEAALGAGGQLRGLGVPLETTATMFSVVAQEGIKASEAGTAISAIMTNLSRGTGDAGKALEALGVSMFDAQGNARDTKDFFMDLDAALASCTEQERAMYISMIAGKPHTKTLNALLDGLNTTTSEGISLWDSLAGSITNCDGAMEQFHTTKTDNLAYNIEILKSGYDALAQSFYDSDLVKPLNELAKFGIDAMDQLNTAFVGGDFSAVISKFGELVPQLGLMILDNIPQILEYSIQIVEALADGIIANADQIGEAAAQVIIKLGEALIRIAPKLIEAGGTLIREIGKGVLEHLPELGEAFSKNNPLLNLAAFVPIAVAGFSKLGGLAKPIIKLFSAFGNATGATKLLTKFGDALKRMFGMADQAPQSGKRMQRGATQMSAAAKNFAGIGAGIALSAAGFWLLSDAAIRIAKAGPEAGAAMALMVAGIGGLMLVAGQVGPKLQQCSTGFLAFGGAVLMVSGGMWIMADACARIAEAGPLAVGALAIMVGGLAGLLAVAGAVGPALQESAFGLIAFGAAIVIASAGMYMMGQAAAAVGEAGPVAAVALGIMVGGLAALMAVAGAVGPALSASAVGLIAFGAAIVLAAAGMYIMVQAAVQLTTAGPEAAVALGLMMVGIIAMGAAAGALAPLLLAGAAALAAFGGALMVVGLGLQMCVTPAIQLMEAVMDMASTFDELSVSAPAAGEGMSALALAMGAFMLEAGALVLAGPAISGAIGMIAFAAGGAMLSLDPMANAFEKVGTAITLLSTLAPIAAAALTSMGKAGSDIKSSFSSIEQSSGKLADNLEKLVSPATSASEALKAAEQIVVQLGAAMTTAGLSAAAVEAALRAGAVSGNAFTQALTALMLVIASVSESISTLAADAPLAGAAMAALAPNVSSAAAAFAEVASSIVTVQTALQIIASLSDTVAATLAAVAAAMTEIIVTAQSMTEVGTIAQEAMASMQAAVTDGMSQVVSIMRTNLQQIVSDVRTIMAQAVSAMRTSMSQLTGAVSSGASQAASAARTGAQSIKSAFNIDLSSAGRNMMAGLKNGINSMQGSVAAAAQRVANMASAAVNKALQIHSPSRVAVQQGQYYDQGLIGGLEKSAPQVARTAASIVEPIAAPSGQTAGRTSIADLSDQLLERRASAVQAKASATRGRGDIVINWNPTYNVTGNSVTQDDIRAADRMSQTEFNQMAARWQRSLTRSAFA